MNPLGNQGRIVAFFVFWGRIVMGLDKIIQFPCEEDGCIYFYDEKRNEWKKICDIKSPQDLPLSVRKPVREAQNEADQILKIPLYGE